MGREAPCELGFPRHFTYGAINSWRSRTVLRLRGSYR